MSKFRLFNLACVFLCCFFVLGTGYVWRGFFAQAKLDEEIESMAVVEDVQVVQNDQNVESADIVDEEPEKEPVEIVEGIPNKINLGVPFTSQAPEKNWDQPWQDACEEAAVLMLDAYYKGYGLSPMSAKDELLRMVEWEQDLGWGGSIEIEKVSKLASWQVGKDFNFKIIENPTVEQIKKYIAGETPVLVVADGKVLPNPHFQNGGPDYHALVIRGYTEDKFITNDPGTQFGENFSYYYDELMDSIRDWNGGDVKNGRRVILIVE